MIVRKFRILGDTAEGSAEHTMIHEPIMVYSNNIISALDIGSIILKEDSLIATPIGDNL